MLEILNLEMSDLMHSLQVFLGLPRRNPSIYNGSSNRIYAAGASPHVTNTYLPYYTVDSFQFYYLLSVDI